MTARAIRLVSFLVLLVVLASGLSLLSSGSAIADASACRPAGYCLNERGLPGRGAGQGNYSPIRLAQFGHCRCCGRDENGHCNHQCCN